MCSVKKRLPSELIAPFTLQTSNTTFEFRSLTLVFIPLLAQYASIPVLSWWRIANIPRIGSWFVRVLSQVILQQLPRRRQINIVPLKANPPAPSLIGLVSLLDGLYRDWSFILGCVTFGMTLLFFSCFFLLFASVPPMLLLMIIIVAIKSSVMFSFIDGVMVTTDGISLFLMALMTLSSTTASLLTFFALFNFFTCSCILSVNNVPQEFVMQNRLRIDHIGNMKWKRRTYL